MRRAARLAATAAMALEHGHRRATHFIGDFAAQAAAQCLACDCCHFAIRQAGRTAEFRREGIVAGQRIGDLMPAGLGAHEDMAFGAAAGVVIQRAGGYEGHAMFRHRARCHGAAAAAEMSRPTGRNRMRDHLVFARNPAQRGGRGHEKGVEWCAMHLATARAMAVAHAGDGAVDFVTQGAAEAGSTNGHLVLLQPYLASTPRCTPGRLPICSVQRNAWRYSPALRNSFAL